ncbi:MAG: sigma-70 family RNA polymerase sigma factor, partial [Gammaproteobacteria bacterium]
MSASPLHLAAAIGCRLRWGDPAGSRSPSAPPISSSISWKGARRQSRKAKRPRPVAIRALERRVRAFGVGRNGRCDAVLTDARVLELVRSERRDEAITLLLPAFRRKVFGLAYSFLRDREAAEDVTQDVFIKVWRALPGFDGRASLSTWIYAIARNASLSALRARRPQSSLSDPEVMDAVEAIDPAPSADAILERAALLRLVDQLPTKQRQVI